MKQQKRTLGVIGTYVKPNTSINLLESGVKG